MAKQKNPRAVTPAGTAIYPHLSAPDTKFNADGEYHVKLAVPREAAAPLLAALDEAADAAVEQAKQEAREKYLKANKPKAADKAAAEITRNAPYTEDEDEYPGCVLLNFKMKAKVTSKKSGNTCTQKPVLVDAKGKVITKDIRIGGGSTVKVSFEFFPYFVASTKQAGISLRLLGVQVITLVEFNGQSAAALGFGEEDGFSADDIEETPVATEFTDEDAAAAVDDDTDSADF